MKALLACLVVIGLCHLSGGLRYSYYYRGGFRTRATNRASYRSSINRATNVRSWSRLQQIKVLSAGSVFISQRMRLRYGSPSYYESHDVNICRNQATYSSYNCSLKSNFSGCFLCPLEDEANVYCCGSEAKERCCSFWHTSEGISVIVWIVIAGLFALTVLAYLAKWGLRACIKRLKPKSVHPQVEEVHPDVETSVSPPSYAEATRSDYAPPPPYDPNYSAPTANRS